MRPRSVLAPLIILGIIGLVALFVASALLPPVALVVILMVVLLASFGIVAWRSPGGN